MTQDEGHLLTLCGNKAWKKFGCFCGSSSARYWVCYSSCQWGAHGARKEGALDLPRAAVWVGTAARASGGTWKWSGYHFLLFFPLFLFQYSSLIFFLSFLILQPSSPLSIPVAVGRPWWEVEHKLMILPDWLYFPCWHCINKINPNYF